MRVCVVYMCEGGGGVVCMVYVCVCSMRLYIFEYGGEVFLCMVYVCVYMNMWCMCVCVAMCICMYEYVWCLGVYVIYL